MRLAQPEVEHAQREALPADPLRQGFHHLAQQGEEGVVAGRADDRPSPMHETLPHDRSPMPGAL